MSSSRRPRHNPAGRTGAQRPSGRSRSGSSGPAGPSSRPGGKRTASSGRSTGGRRDERSAGGRRDERSTGGRRGAAGRRGESAERSGARGWSGKPGGKGQAAKDKAAKREAANARADAQARREREMLREAFERNIERHPSYTEDGVRLQKLLSNLGVASRRTAEELIMMSRVEVDGEIVRELGLKVDPEKCEIYVEGVKVQLDVSRKYFVFNKPRGVVSTMHDPEGRPCLSDCLPNPEERLFHVGRLDHDTEGLLLLTNDGEFAQKMQHPKFGVRKRYMAEVQGVIRAGDIKQLTEGIALEDGLATAYDVCIIDQSPGKTLVELIIHEGRNRIVRRMLTELGFPVLQLVRTQFGDVVLGELRSGNMRPLTSVELTSLENEADSGSDKHSSRSGRKPRTGAKRRSDR